MVKENNALGTDQTSNYQIKKKAWHNQIKQKP